jgi:hypothetical protein
MGRSDAHARHPAVLVGAGEVQDPVFDGLAFGAFAALGILQYRLLDLQAVFFTLI